MTEETPYKNQPDLERSGKMGTEEKPSSRQEMPLRTWQYKCTKDGQTFSSQMELNNHYRAVHGMQAPDQQKESVSSSAGGNEMSDTTKEELNNENEDDTENKKSKAMGEEDEKENWGESSKGKNWSMKENKDVSHQSGEYGSSSQGKAQGQYRCEKDGQMFSNQEELDQHNKKIHNMETKEFGSELEEKDKESMDEREESVSGYESKNSSGELSKENWSKQDRENDWMNQKNKTETNDQRMEYNKSSQSSEGQYRCQRDGQVFSSQEELNQHNQKAHSMDSLEKSTEL